MIAGLLERFSSGPGVAILLGTLVFLGVIKIVIVAIVSSERGSVRVAEIQADLKREMIQRGMSAEEIERVLAAGGANPEEVDRDRYAAVGPATCDVAVEDGDGDWQRAILLDMRGDSCRVHYVGHDIDDNKTVDRSRVRFPSSVAFDEAARGEWPEDYNAQEATVERDGEWLPAYVLMHLDRCYVHFVGQDWSENEWVEEARVRFSGRPADSSLPPRGSFGRPVKDTKPVPHELEV
jgi:hypothetical protein